MNKQKFVDFLRQPESISDSSLSELENLVTENPYFHSAHTVIARASKLLKDRQAAKKVNTAAIYATSRKALKKYIQGNVIFTEQVKPTSSPVEKATRPTPKPIVEQEKPSFESTPVAPVEEPAQRGQALSQSDHDSLIDEVYENIEEWKKSRNHFLDYELSLEESNSIQETEVASPEVEAPIEEKPTKPKSTVDEIKSQIADEIIAEEEEVEKAMKVIKKKGSEDKKETKKTKPTVVTESDKIVDEEVEKEGEDIPEKAAEDSSDQSMKISKEKESLKLSPGNKGGKKFRLNILNRPIPKSKAAGNSPKTKEVKTTEAKGTTKVKAAPVKKATAKSKTATTKKKATTTKAKSKGTTKAKSTTGKTKKSDSKDDEKKKPKETQTIAKKQVKNEQVDLIDKFISTNPSIEPGRIKSGEGPVIDLSEKSRDFPSGIVTENMAKIFESQGKTENAISIYEKLILKNPEKKSYFATRIKNLKNN